MTPDKYLFVRYAHQEWAYFAIISERGQIERAGIWHRENVHGRFSPKTHHIAVLRDRGAADQSDFELADFHTLVFVDSYQYIDKDFQSAHRAIADRTDAPAALIDATARHAAISARVLRALVEDDQVDAMRAHELTYTINFQIDFYHKARR